MEREVGTHCDAAPSESNVAVERVVHGVAQHSERRVAAERVLQRLVELATLLFVGQRADGVVDVRLGVALEVDEAERELQSADAVGDRVVDPLQQCGAPVRHALDQGEFPERPRPVERRRGDRGGEIQEIAERPGLRQSRRAGGGT